MRRPDPDTLLAFLLFAPSAGVAVTIVGDLSPARYAVGWLYVCLLGVEVADRFIATRRLLRQMGRQFAWALRRLPH